MQLYDLRRRPFDPRRATTFLDSCAFDPKEPVEEEAAAREILAIWQAGGANLIIAHSTKSEIDHLRTPDDVKRLAAGMVFTYLTNLTPNEERQRDGIHTLLTGNGKPEKYRIDALNVYEAAKYGGCFVTTDARVLNKKDDIQRIRPVRILKPTEWIEFYRACTDA